MTKLPRGTSEPGVGPGEMIPPPRKAPLIGLYSSVMQSGKSTVADHLVLQHGFRRVRFAGPLKDMARALFTHFATDQTSERMIEGDLKDSPHPMLRGVTPRWVLQSLGTQWGRELIYPDLWVDMAMAEVDRVRRTGTPVVIDDLRFPNELAALVGAGGRAFRIIRPDARPAEGQTAEGLLDDAKFHLTLYNVGSKDAFLKTVSDMAPALGI